MIKIDARGENCPIPVIKTRKALKEIETDGIVQILVDNKIATENLEKMSNETGCKIDIQKISDEHFEVTITKGIGGEIKEEKESQIQKISNKKVVVISSDKMGEGDEELGKALLKSYIFALSEAEEKVSKVIFYNKGAFLTCEGSDSIDDLLNLQNNGVEIFTCGACLNYYKLSENLKVGSSTNMYNILSYTLDADSVLKP